MTLDPISGAVVSAELERLEHGLFEADWAEAKASLGRDPRTTELARTPGQRRADALVEMAVRSKSCPAGARRPGPLFTVLVGWETLHGRICELEDGTVVPPGSVLSWLEEADLERAVFGPGRKVEMGAATRLVPGPGRPATASDLERAVFGPAPPPRDQPQHPVLHRGHPPGRRGAGPPLHPPLLRPARPVQPGRPHPALVRGRSHHPGERAAPVQLPQPTAQPAAATGRVRGFSG